MGLSVSKNSGIKPVIYRSVSKNSYIKPALLLLHTVLLLGTVFYVKIRLKYNVSIEQNSGIDRYRTKPGIEPVLLSCADVFIRLCLPYLVFTNMVVFTICAFWNHINVYLIYHVTKYTCIIKYFTNPHFLSNHKS